LLSNGVKTAKPTDIDLTSTAVLLRRAEADGFHVALVPGDLVNVTGGRKGAPIVAELKAAKAEILALLKARESEAPLVVITYYTGERLTIPQEVWSPDWPCPF
jgi:hypothetical protein